MNAVPQGYCSLVGCYLKLGIEEWWDLLGAYVLDVFETFCWNALHGEIDCV